MEDTISFQLVIPSKQKQQKKLITFPRSILNFNIQILNNNHDQPYPIPPQILQSQYPFTIMRKFLQAHQYKPEQFKVVKPINSKEYSKLVDSKTFQILNQFTLPQNCENAKLVVDLSRFIRFHQLHDAVCAAIATNYYISGNNQKQFGQFKRNNKLQELSSEQICQIIKEYEEIFNLIDTKAKEQLLKQVNQN